MEEGPSLTGGSLPFPFFSWIMHKKSPAIIAGLEFFSIAGKSCSDIEFDTLCERKFF
jgi:hypothetical protein